MTDKEHAEKIVRLAWDLANARSEAIAAGLTVHVHYPEGQDEPPVDVTVVRLSLSNGPERPIEE